MKTSTYILQIIGWGYTIAPLYDKDDQRLNNPKKSRYLKMGYVRDHTNEKECDKEYKKTQICVLNGTSAFNDSCEFSELNEN